MKITPAIFSLGFYLPLSGFLEPSELFPELEKADLSIESGLEEATQVECSKEPSCENGSI